MRKSPLMALMLLLSVALFTGCTSDEDRWRQGLINNANEAQSRLARLNGHLKAGHVGNAVLLKEYAKQIKVLKPEYAGIADALSKDASTEGPMYKGLEMRLNDSRQDIDRAVKGGYDSAITLNREFKAIVSASSPANYGMMLSDPINVLADMSGGKLGRVQALKKEASLAQNQAQDLGAGSQLVGNPNYGHWQTRSNGTSFWAFYGQYRLFSDLFSGPVYYDRWSRNRDYSYYHDRGRDYYTSPKARAEQQKTQQVAQKKFASTGKKFSSPYAKPKHSSVKPKGTSAARAPSKFQSAYASKSSSSSSSYSSYSANSAGAAAVAVAAQRKSSGWGSSYNSRNMSSSSRSSRGGK